ncbi:sensor histidine kinase [Carboxylicivirga mesophila]|uniref:histidine kinase n=1 Tax=Carboxylicivirga mesophila TaxID=1166478 RepID=A0ABS5K607_9BACT|nr:ATP-binding protein [Carboxylicivirga mesophila]MBS2210381.1 sensor histidine kinase [Carboxylicivirga mesophila]
MSLTKLFANKKSVLNRFKKIEPTIYDIITPVNRYIGQKYFEATAIQLCQLIEADYVIIGRYSAQTNSVESIAFADGAKVMPQVNYSLENTPCDNVIGKNTCRITSGAWERFPKDSFLADKKIEGYIGIPLFNSGYQPNGIFIALYRNPIAQAEVIESLVYLFTPRMSSEIEHIKAKEELNLRNKELEITHLELKRKNTELDISLKKLHEAQKKSAENDQLKSTFLANLSHEIRTPMNVILGFSELLKTESLSSEERDEYIGIINLNGLQLLKVMDNLIDISKLQTRLIQEGPKLFNLNSLLENMLKHYMREVKLMHKPLQLYLEKGLEDSNDQIITDQQGLLKVLNHLLDNAVKFTKDGWVKFGYTVAEDRLWFFVKDTGIGIPEGKEEVIFDMFRQVSTSNNREFGGNGLGLAISQKYIDTLGGEIWLDKTYKEGAKFCFTIPFQKTHKLNNEIPKTSLM